MSRILSSLDSNLVGRDNAGKLISRGGFRSGDHGKQFDVPSPSTVVQFDDFVGDVLNDPWNAVEGTDTTGSTQLVLAGAIGGALRLATGDDDANGTHLTDLTGVTSYLNWQASNGGLNVQARVKLSRITLAYLFIGFTDVITAEVPINGTNGADTIATTATDAVGFMFDTGMTTAGMRLVGVATDVDATIQNIGSTYSPVADDYATYRVELSTTGVASFFINGVQVGATMTGAVTAGADLTPCIYASNLDGTSAFNCDIDYIHVSMARAADGDAT